MVDADARVTDRWLAVEMTRFHRSFVSQPRSLSDLLLEAAPEAPTRGGEAHRYDVATLRRIAEVAGPLLRRKLRLPASRGTGDCGWATRGRASLRRDIRGIPVRPLLNCASGPWRQGRHLQAARAQSTVRRRAQRTRAKPHIGRSGLPQLFK